MRRLMLYWRFSGTRLAKFRVWFDELFNQDLPIFDQFKL